MSDTPRTDAAHQEYLRGIVQGKLASSVHTDFARQLERELSAERELRLDAFNRGYDDAKIWLGAELAEAKRTIAELNDHLDGLAIHTHSDSCQRAACVLRRENARLMKQLEEARCWIDATVANCGIFSDPPKP